MKEVQNSREAKLSYAFESIVRKHKEKFGKYFAITYLENENQKNKVPKVSYNDLKRQIELMQELVNKIGQIQKNEILDVKKI